MVKVLKTDRELRKLAFILGGYFIALALFLFYGFHLAILSVNGWIIFIALVLLSLSKPKLLLPVSYLYTGLLSVLGWLNARILLGLIFFLLFTPISIVRRLLHKDTLELTFSSSKRTYRTPVLPDTKNDMRRPY